MIYTCFHFGIIHVWPVSFLLGRPKGKPTTLSYSPWSVCAQTLSQLLEFASQVENRFQKHMHIHLPRCIFIASQPKPRRRIGMHLCQQSHLHSHMVRELPILNHGIFRSKQSYARWDGFVCPWKFIESKVWKIMHLLKPHLDTIVMHRARKSDWHQQNC